MNSYFFLLLEIKECNTKTHFTCGNNHCVPKSWTCDNIDDCGDNTDETTAWLKCPAHYHCDDKHFQCKKSKQCIFRYEHCDGSYDCGSKDDSDEQDCGLSIFFYNLFSSIYRC